MFKKVLVILLAVSFQTAAQNKIDMQAHRGGRGLMPENSIEAMIWAIDQGVQTLELDLVISKDGQVVVSHDTYMASDFMLKPDGTEISKTEEKQLLLYAMDYEQIKSYDGGSKVHPQFSEQKKLSTYKPLFTALIDSVEHYIAKNKLKPVAYNVEIKSSVKGDQVAHPAPEEFVQRVMEVVNSKKIGQRTIVQSFDVRPLQVLHRDFPKQKVSFLIANKDDLKTNLSHLGFRPDALSPYFSLVTPELVKEAHDLKIAVIPWTVNTVEDLKKMADMHVDGIISDFPNLLVDLYGSYQKK
jgi:glycerophosphoryl diester phosphodiesterase